MLEPDFFDRNVVAVARALIGCRLTVGGVGGVIVETEAYHQREPAAHSYGGQTPRNAVMFGPPGRAYVYRSYGIHWCLNFVCAREGTASAVLIRALEPTHGIAIMRRRRGVQDLRALCSGPGKLCRALGLTGAHNGLRLDAPPFSLAPREGRPRLAAGPRIGITKATDLHWRFGLKNSPFLSRNFAPRRRDGTGPDPSR
jgi:DNA-3-methyladenine glycosylase